MKRFFLLVSILFLILTYLYSTYLDDFQGAQGATTINLVVAVLPLFSPFLLIKDWLVPPSLEAPFAVAFLRHFLVPSQSAFVENPFTVPDYRNETWAWNALGHVNDTADVVPPHCGVEPCSLPSENPLVDVFFVGPSTLYSSSQWNSDWADPITRYLMREAIIPQQAQLFNSVGRVFSPQIRQMTGFAYFATGDLDPVRQKAASIAYGDVRAAFRYYLETWGENRPIILAGHSQGAEYMLLLLMDEFKTNPSLRKRLVAAYVPGMPVFQERLEAIGFPPCQYANQTGCIATWQTYEEGVDERLFHFEASDPRLRALSPTSKRVCVNPMTGSTTLERIEAKHNLGGMHLVQWYQNFMYLLGPIQIPKWPWWSSSSSSLSSSLSYPVENRNDPKIGRQIKRAVDGLLGLKPHVVGARCSEESGVLYADPPPRGELGSSPMYAIFPVWRFGSFPGRNLHPYDFNLYWNCIRRGAEIRVDAYFATLK